jgi:two-component system LytT family response regulator
MTLKAVIVDDEEPARELIKVFLKDFENIEVSGEAMNGFDGAKLVNSVQPDLVFLDIQMPKVDGFEMLELLDNPPKIIFCTAFDEYAIKAFEHNAVDYLLKPFSSKRFSEAIAKVMSISVEERPTAPQPAEYHKPLERVVIKDRKEIIILDVLEIDYLEAQDDYVEVNTRDNHWLKQKTMKYFEESLDQNQFCRIHRKYILNLKALAKIDKLGKETYLAQLKSGKSIPISNSGYQSLKKLLEL